MTSEFSTLEFFALGLLLFATAWVLQRRAWSRQIRGISASVLLVAFAFSLWFLHGSATTLGGLKWYEEPPVRELLLFGVMLAGMVARYISRAIEDRRAKIAAAKAAGQRVGKVPLEFDRWEFAYPLLFSIATFGALLSQIDHPGISIVNITLSFQTGFFWQTILASNSTLSDSK